MLHLLATTAFLFTTMEAQTVSAHHAPKSGFIHTVSPNVKGPSTASRIWFTPSMIREDFLEGDEIISMAVHGKSSDWCAFPLSGRIEERNPREFRTYPERIRESYETLLVKMTKTADTNVKGYPAWKYTWHEAARQSGDVGTPASDMAIWIMANSVFPLTLRTESSASGRMEIQSLQMDVAVNPIVFQKPEGLKPVRKFGLPERPFRITIEERHKNIYGVDRITTRGFKGDGSNITITAEARDAKATSPDFRAQPEQVNYSKGAGELVRFLQLPHWQAVKRVENSNLLGLEAERLVSRIPSVDYEWHVADHSILGTISLQRVAKYETMSNTISVKSIDFY